MEAKPTLLALMITAPKVPRHNHPRSLHSIRLLLCYISSVPPGAVLPDFSPSIIHRLAPNLAIHNKVRMLSTDVVVRGTSKMTHFK